MKENVVAMGISYVENEDVNTRVDVYGDIFCRMHNRIRHSPDLSTSKFPIAATF